VLLLHEGRVVQDGSAPEVVAHYEQQTMGAGSQVVWDDPASAPGNELVQFQSVRVVDQDGNPATTADVRQPVGVEIGFKVLTFGRSVVPKIKLVDQHGAICFNAMDTDARWHDPTPPGEYLATAWIPENLLNEGRHAVDVEVVTIATPKLHAQAAVHQVVAFHVYDPAEGDSARGLFAGQWKGVVRPLLDWTCEER